MYKTHTRFGELLEGEMSKKCMLLWREAHLQVKKIKTPHIRSTFGSWDVEKVHAVVARSTFASEKDQSTSHSEHFWTFGCRFAWHAQGILHPATCEQNAGSCKNPGPFQMCFHTLSLFFPYGSSKRWLHTFTKEFTWARKGKGTRRGKGEERERNRKKGPCLTRTIFDTKSYRFRYRFVIVRESCVRSFFSGNGCNHQKKSVATTQAPSLCRIWHAFVGTPLRR